MKTEYYVYMHITPNGKRYIGITCCEKPNRRWQNGYGYTTQPFYRAIKKYGWNNIEHIILASGLSSSEASTLERMYIEKYHTTNKKYGYNMTDGGEYFGHMSEEHKQKIGDANRGERNGMYGHRYTDEERQYMSEHSVWNGRNHTEETKQKMSLARKEHPIAFYGKEHPMAHAVLQYDLNGKYINRYDTAKEAEEKTGTLRSTICTCLKGRKKTAGGYIWKYADDVDSCDDLSMEEVSYYVRHDFNMNSVKSFYRKINQYDLNGVHINTYMSVTDACRSVGGRSSSCISACARGKRPTAYGYIWKYAT